MNNETTLPPGDGELIRPKVYFNAAKAIINPEVVVTELGNVRFAAQDCRIITVAGTFWRKWFQPFGLTKERVIDDWNNPANMPSWEFLPITK